jgi:predicted  nucleic acid-binding Zn ribbon protein
MSSKLGKPFHYALRTSSTRLIKECPLCGCDWRISEPIADRFDLKCETCGFVSMAGGKP